MQTNPYCQHRRREKTNLCVDYTRTGHAAAEGFRDAAGGGLHLDLSTKKNQTKIKVAAITNPKICSMAKSIRPICSRVFIDYLPMRQTANRPPAYLGSCLSG